MEFLQLQYFCELAKRQHLTQTASAMMVSPSAISNSISRLENELGVKLFDRIGRNLRLNSYGEAYFKHVTRAISELEDGQRELSDMQGSRETRLVLATTNPFVWQEPIQAFHRLHPYIQLRHIHFDPISSKSPLPHEPADIIIACPDAFSHPEWDSAPLFEDKIVLAVPPGHRFSGRSSMELAEAKDEWFVSLSKSSFSVKCDELCREAGFEPKSRIECDYMMRPKMILNENMVCLTTYNGRNTGIFKGVPIIPLTDVSAKRDQSIFWKKSRYLPSAVKLLRDYMLDLYRDYIPDNDNLFLDVKK